MEAYSAVAKKPVNLVNVGGFTQRRYAWAAWALVLLPFVALAIARFDSGSGLEADDYAQYLMHAQAVAEGRPYTDIGYIYSPYAHWIGPRAAPPGVPLMLAAVYSMFGPNIAVMKALMLCFAVVFVALAGLYFAQHGESKLGLGVALLCGLSPALVHASSQLLTDVPFAALLWSIIYVIDRPGQFDAKRIAFVTIAGVWLLMIRSAGLLLIPALLLFTVLRYREHRLRPLIPMMFWSLGLVVLAAVVNLGDTSVVRLHPERVIVWLKNFHVMNLLGYFEGIFEGQLYPFTLDRANDYFHVLSSGLMLVGLIAWLPKSLKRFGTMWAVIYGFTLLLIPAHQTRYLWPLYPFFIFGVLNGVRQLVQVGARRPDLAPVAALAFAVLLVPGSAAAVVRRPIPVELGSLPAVQEVYAYLQHINEREEVRVSFPKPRSLTWATGIPAMGPIYGPTPCLLAEFHRRRMTHVVAGSVRPTERGVRGLAQLARAHPAIFVEELKNQNFTVYRFRAPPLAELGAADQTCGAR
jgi:hypothetical protein